VAHLSDLYDEEIAYFDGQFAALLAELLRRRQLDRTLLVFASDHGEELYEHGQWSHCRDIAFETVLGTPLLLRLPRVRGGVVREAPVQNLDIVPTVLDYLGIAAGEVVLEGKSLRPLIERDAAPYRYLFSGQGRKRTVRDGGLKLIWDLETQAAELFDLAADPGETVDVARQRPAEAERLRQILSRWVEATEGPASEGVRRADELERRLRAVGYL
jgi:arylsulfatase A-like enzyme